jgi:hypothetical protein
MMFCSLEISQENGKGEEVRRYKSWIGKKQRKIKIKKKKKKKKLVMKTRSGKGGAT